MTGITVLGPVGVGDQGSPLPPRDRVVLSVLVARRGHEVPADTIAEALWGEHLPPSWHKVVQGCIARLRRRLGHDGRPERPRPERGRDVRFGGYLRAGVLAAVAIAARAQQGQ